MNSVGVLYQSYSSLARIKIPTLVKGFGSYQLIFFGISDDRSWDQIVILPENIVTWLISYTLRSELRKQTTQVRVSCNDGSNKNENNSCINRLVWPVNKLIAYSIVFIRL